MCKPLNAWIIGAKVDLCWFILFFIYIYLHFYIGFVSVFWFQFDIRHQFFSILVYARHTHYTSHPYLGCRMHLAYLSEIILRNGHYFWDSPYWFCLYPKLISYLYKNLFASIWSSVLQHMSLISFFGLVLGWKCNGCQYALSLHRRLDI